MARIAGLQSPNGIENRAMTTCLPHRTAFPALVLAVAAGCAGPSEPEPVDLVVRGGAIHTADARNPVAEALAVRDGRFVFVGDAREAERWIGEATDVIELNGRAVIPGLIDGHVHLESGLSLIRGVDLTGIADRDEWMRRIAARAAELGPGAWIVGGRWDHTLSGGEFPSLEELDPVTPENPVLLSDIDGHTAWANSLALEIAGVDATTPDPPGGRILRYASGDPTGILLETAGGLVEEHVPPLSSDEEREILRQTFRAAARLGLTGVHTMAGLDRIPAYVGFGADGELPLRVWYGAFGAEDRVDELAGARDDARSALATVTAERGPTFEVGYAKLMADGVLSARTAALLAPYADALDESGFMVTEFDDLAGAVTRIHEAGFPVAIHAIGDRAVRVSLDAFERAASSGPRPGLADRIEHIEVLDPEDAPRFEELGVLASFNPHHCITGIDVYNTDRLGESRAAWSFAWGAVRDAGATLVFGSDWATAPLDPLRQLYAATVREKPAGGPPGGWYPGQRVSWREALTAYTLAPAAASGWDGEIGSIEVGKWADFVVLNAAVPDPPDASILDLRVDSTWLGGASTYRAER
ncbi:MAG: amidohydrolase [Acidobacteria bacterium]|nr:amidohydrolase [Acidobacteriota bacterium]MYA46792.1 amidohydrolase [Acidobacteriota bacterium]MYI39551.1 amidohydrolase [Acidobacteriota bacterium]